MDSMKNRQKTIRRQSRRRASVHALMNCSRPNSGQYRFCTIAPHERHVLGLQGPSDERIQSGADDLFSRDVVDEEQHPCLQGLDGTKALAELLLGGGHLFHLRAIDRFDPCIACRKVTV
jgi:hypothetical protein